MTASLGYILSQLQRWTSPDLTELSDAELLERFVRGRDESAFTALVARHGEMVLRSCRRVLGNAPEAEDAFQAAFLILARRAHTLRPCPDFCIAWPVASHSRRGAELSASARMHRSARKGPPHAPIH